MDSSALVVTRGAEIYAQGTASGPIVFTSLHDINAGNNWRPVNSEWGNLTILGDAVIAEGARCSAIFIHYFFIKSCYMLAPIYWLLFKWCK